MTKRSPGDMQVSVLATYLGGTCSACGTTSTAITVPAGATSAMIRAAGAAIYFQVAGSSAGSTSPGYVAQDMVGYVPPIDNLSAFHVAGSAAAAIAYVSFFQD